MSSVNAAVASLPMREAVRYTKGNVKVTADEFNKYAESHANALFEYGLVTGDSVAVWMTESQEKHVTLLAAAKLGLKVVEFDASINSMEDLRAALSMAEAKTIIFDPISGDVDQLMLLRKAIPEFFEYDDTYGQPFHSKYFPHLKYFIQTGFDIEIGCLNYKHCFLPNSTTDYVGASTIKDSTPLHMSVTKKGDGSGIEASKTVSHKDALGLPSYLFAKNLADKTYFEI